jgi:hypothetical protein
MVFPYSKVRSFCNAIKKKSQAMAFNAAQALAKGKETHDEAGM